MIDGVGDSFYNKEKYSAVSWERERDSMKWVHLSDLHIGKIVNGYSMLEEQRDIFEKILEIIEQEAPDAVLLSGDIYDKAAPSAEAMALLDWLLTALAAEGRAVLLISGNHDSAERLSVGARLMQKSRVYVAPVYRGELETVTLRDTWGEVDFVLLPFVKPAMVRAVFPGEEIADTDQAVRTALQGIGADPSRRRVLLCHQFVQGAASCDSEEKHIGGLDAVGGSAFDGFDYVALGHLHNPQKVGQERIRYCGTPLKYSFSEVHSKKSVTVVTLQEKGNLQIRTVPLQPRHDLQRFRGRFEELLKMGSEDYVQLTLTDETEIPHAYHRLREKYPRIMVLDYDNTRTRTRADFSGAEKMRGKSEIQLFSELFRQQNGREMDERQTQYMEKLLRELKGGEEE